ncbi:hypothetical protein Lser_V15G42228 [Lactuca serriola]
MVNAVPGAPAVNIITPPYDEEIGLYLRTMEMCFNSDLNSNHCSFR